MTGFLAPKIRFSINKLIYFGRGCKAIARSIRCRKELEEIILRPDLKKSQIVCIVLAHNEAGRLPYLVQYYRELGVEHFIFIDNMSSDETVSYLKGLSDVSIFKASGSFKSARYGMDWVNNICRRHAVGKWVLHVDADEFLVYPGIESTPLKNFVNRLEANNIASLQTMMIDMYSDKDTEANHCGTGQNPLDVCPYFDREGYEFTHDEYYRYSRTTWIKGGVRTRLFFNTIQDGPALNKTPLVRWRRHYAFLRCAHELWPAHLNESSQKAKSGMTGALLHFKFLSDLSKKLSDSYLMSQHTSEYHNYQGILEDKSRISFLADGISERYVGSKSLIDSGLMRSPGSDGAGHHRMITMPQR